MTADEKAKIIEQQIRDIWSSLESHLHVMHKKSWEGKRFHKQCVRDYSKQLYNLTKLL